MISEPLLGQAACLGAALCWAVAVTLFRPSIIEHGAWVVNLAKSLIAAALLGVTTLAAGQWRALAGAPGADLGLVALSGLLGMSFGDTALFGAVRRLGVHRTLLLQNLGPVFAAALAIGLYGEQPTAGQMAGAAVILGGVALVVAPSRSAPAPSADAAGLALAVLAALGQASGIVLAKAGMETVPFLAASFLRLSAASVGLIGVLLALRRLGPALAALTVPSSLARLALPSVIGTYVAILLMMAGIAFARASVAAVLLATPPIFSLFIDARVEGTPITTRGLGGTLLAVAGVAVLALSS